MKNRVGCRTSLLLMGLSCLSFTGCLGRETTKPDSARIEQLKAEQESLLKEVYSLTQNKACKEDSDCELFPYGEIPCGGPGGFIPYAIGLTDVNSVQSRLARYNAIDQELNRIEYKVGICVIQIAPPPVCENQACSLGQD